MRTDAVPPDLDRGPMGFRIATVAVALAVVAAVVGRITLQVLDLGYAQRTWTPTMAAILAVAIALRGRPITVVWARRAATTLTLTVVALCLFFLVGHLTGYQTPLMAGVFPIGAVDVSSLPFEGRPAPTTLVLTLTVAVVVLLLDRASHAAVLTTAALITVMGSSAAWVLMEVAFPNSFRIEQYLQTSTGATTSSSLMLVGLTVAAALARPYRLPLGPLLSTRLWPVLVITVAMLILGTIVSQVGYRLALEAGASVRSASGVAFLLQGTAVIGLVVLTVWFASVQQRRSTEQAHLSASAEAFASVVYSSAVAMAVLDRNGFIQDVNTAYERLLGRPADRVIGRHRNEFLAPSAGSAAEAPQTPGWWTDLPAAGGTHHERREFRHASGRAVWADSTVAIARDPLRHGEDLLLEQLVDVTGVMATEQELAFRSSHDALTGQLTRHEITEYIDHTLAQSDRPILVSIVGLDRFRMVNEAYGHPVGDAVLVEVARRLAAAVAPYGAVGRVAGDEFAVIQPLPPGDTDGAVRRSAEWLMASVEQDLTISGVIVRTGGSIGVEVGTPGDRGTELLTNASAALTQAKRDGGRRWQSFDTTFDGHARERLLLLTQLRTGMRDAPDEQFQTWFQPIVSLTTMETVGYEALIRWHHPERGVVPAGLWIEAAETDLPLIHRIGLITARQSAAFAAGLPTGQRVSVNVSGAHLSSRDFPEFAERILDAHRRDPGRLVLELTETTLATVHGPSRSRLHQLVDAGVGLWGDDFGTGYSSVAHLRDLPLTGLKLDKSFTAGLDDPASTSYRIADGLSGLAHGLGLETVAEGIETPQQARRVAAAGWELGQGWLFGRPNPPEHWAQPATAGNEVRRGSQDST